MALPSAPALGLLAIADAPLEPEASGAVEARPMLAIEDIPVEAGAVVPEGVPKRRRTAPAAAGDVAPWVAGEFTPADAILDGTKCLARLWAGGVGGQCKKRPVPDSDLCKAHRAHQAHGKVDGPVPLAKLREFRRVAAGLAGEVAVEPVGVDYF